MTKRFFKKAMVSACVAGVVLVASGTVADARINGPRYGPFAQTCGKLQDDVDALIAQWNGASEDEQEVILHKVRELVEKWETTGCHHDYGSIHYRLGVITRAMRLDSSKMSWTSKRQIVDPRVVAPGGTTTLRKTTDGNSIPNGPAMKLDTPQILEETEPTLHTDSISAPNLTGAPATKLLRAKTTDSNSIPT